MIIYLRLIKKNPMANNLGNTTLAACYNSKLIYVQLHKKHFDICGNVLFSQNWKEST